MERKRDQDGGTECNDVVNSCWLQTLQEFATNSFFQHQTNIRPLICVNPIKPAERSYKQDNTLFPAHFALHAFELYT